MPKRARLQPTMKDVARRAGVAVSSVSRVLNEHPDVSEDLRTRVIEATKALGYQPDMVAQGLRRGSTSMVGFYVRDISNPLFADIARGAEDRLRKSGYAMVVATNSEGEPDRDADYILLFGQRRVDALMLSLGNESNAETLRALNAVNVPIVLLDRDIPFMEANAVHSDSFTGVRDATLDLLQQGDYVRAALIAGPRETRASRERLRGFMAAHQEMHRTPQEGLIRMGSYTTEYGYEQMTELLEADDAPNAVICGGVQLSCGAIRAIHDHEMRVGRDIAFVSCDEIDLMQVFDPPLSVVRRDARLMGELAASLLLDSLEGAEPRVEGMPTEYVRRGSSTVVAPKA
jgi:LacI family transcriptional regulator